MGLFVDDGAAKNMFLKASQELGMAQDQSAKFQDTQPGEEDDLVAEMLNGITMKLSENPQPYLEHIQQAGPEMPRAVGEITAELMTVEVEAMMGAGVQPPKETLLDIGRHVVNEVFDLAAAAGVWQPKSEQDVETAQREAVLWATDSFLSRAEGNGMLTPEDMGGLGRAMEPYAKGNMTVGEFNQSFEDG